MNPSIKKLPAGFLSRLEHIFPRSKHLLLLESFTRLKPTTFRLNLLKTTPSKALRLLEQSGFQVKPVHWHRDAFILKNRGLTRKLTSSELFEQGLIYLQSLSSMIPALVLKPMPGEKILDLCAAPGGKTTLMAMTMENRGEILAVEKYALRYEKLKANIERQGAKIVRTEMKDGKYTWIENQDYFDRTLVDAPCTNEALFNTIYPRSFKRWREKHVLAMSRLQAKLLVSAFRALRPGGQLLYSTCTFGPEENERVVSGLLEQFPRQLEALPLGLELPNFSPALREYGREKFCEGLVYARRVLPTPEMHGLFLCLMRKRTGPAREEVASS